MSTDPSVLSSCGSAVQGAATDGLTQVLLRMVSGLPGTGCFNIVSSSPPDQGSVTTDVTTTQSVGSNNDAFSFYMTPTPFNGTGDSRQVQIQFTFTPNIGYGNTTMFTVPLNLVRPPLLLVHGLWADRKTWPSFWMRSPASSYITYAADYGPTHDASFTTNEKLYQGFVQSTLQQARDAGYAVTQVDVVAHSMGGILTRLYALDPNYMRPDNFNQGDIHRFLTLDTPHGGSSFANLLVTLHSQDPVDLENTVTGLTHGSVVNGAVCDLAENSVGLEPLSSPTNIMSQVVTGTGGPIGKFWGGVSPLGLGSFESALTATRCVSYIPSPTGTLVCTKYVPIFNQTTLNAFRFSRPNDAIIALCSQQGGVGGSCPDTSPGPYNFPGLIHFGADVFFFTVVAGVTNSQDVANTAFPLLDGPDSALVSIPGVPANGTGVPLTVTGTGAGPAFTSQCVTGSPPPMKLNIALGGKLTGENTVNVGVSSVSAASGDSRVQITTPTNGQVFAPGATVSVTVSIASSLTANDVALLVPLIGRVEGTNYNGSSYDASFTIPDTVAGPFDLTPVVIDSSNNPINGVTTTIAVRPTTPPTSLTLPQTNYTLTSVGATERVDVIGNYPGGVQRDLSSSAAGTTFKSSNTSVITVDTEGNVVTTGFGTAVVTVANMGVQAFATFTVENPAHPLAAQDVTAATQITPLGLRVDRNTGFFDETVELTPAASTPVVGPLYLVVTGLPTGVTLVNAGTTQNITPMGSPYYKLLLPDGLTLPSGTVLAKTIQFLNPDRTRIAYTAKVYRTLMTP